MIFCRFASRSIKLKNTKTPIHKRERVSFFIYKNLERKGECSMKDRPNWIGVNEPPKDENQRVLVKLRSDTDMQGYPKIDTDRFVNGRWVRWNNSVTHWMPLPETETRKE